MRRTGPLGADPYLALADDAAVSVAIASRSEQQARLQRATEVATWTGTLRDLAERASPLVVRTAGDRVHHGRLVAVGIDHVAVAVPDAMVVLIATDTLRSIRLAPGHRAPVATGDRERSQDRTLIEALDFLIEERRDVVIRLRQSADLLTGQIVGLGDDVVTMRFAHGEHGTVYLPTHAIGEVMVGH